MLLTLTPEHNACAAEYPFTNWAYPTEFSLGYSAATDMFVFKSYIF